MRRFAIVARSRQAAPNLLSVPSFLLSNLPPSCPLRLDSHFGFVKYTDAAAAAEGNDHKKEGPRCAASVISILGRTILGHRIAALMLTQGAQPLRILAHTSISITHAI